MNRSKSACLLLALSALAPVAAWADPVADLVQAEMVRSKTPGVAVAVIDQGRITRIQGFGEANIEHHVPVHPDTLFKTGATGMQLTAAAVMLLVEDGKIDLDAPVTRYLAKAPAKWGKVTIRQLLDHTSGLPATPNGDFRTDYTNDQLLGIIAAQDLNFPAGSRWRFSYADYIVLGFVIEEVTGEHWTRFMAHRIFAPLGMHTARGIDELAIVPNRAAGYELRGGALRNAEWVSPTANSTADGSLYLSALDFAAWAQAMSQHRLLSKASWETLSQPARLGNGASCTYVPGWSIDPAGKAPAWGQSGSWQGFQTYTLRYPSQDLTVAIYANGENADAGHLARAIAGLTEPALAGEPAHALADADPRMTARARALIGDIAAGRSRPSDFVDFAKLDFTELTAQYAGMLASLGPLADFALFERPEQCGETDYRYRARYAKGMVEIRLGLNAGGKIANLQIDPLSDWNEPL
ncbi:MAG: serine hydrolase [Novosphingobium sp.]